MAADRAFTPDLFRFLNDLAENNNRDWFQASKSRYMESVRDPALAFISDFTEPLNEISPHFRADPRPVGGSLFRIHRDVRFSKDKRPYKTAVGIQFRHQLGKDAHAPGFYLHLAPRDVFLGMGSWHPDGPTLRSIRDRIVEKPDEWQEVLDAPSIASGDVELVGERLKRPPRGFDAEHPFLNDLKRKDFIGTIRLSQKQATSPGFREVVAEGFATGAPLVAFLCRAVGAPF
jgi:uncharacterized protein (TIGR02453 family)